MNPIAAIVFDFDGVLADSEPLHLRAYQEIFRPMGVALDRDEYYGRYLGYDDEGLFRAMAADRGWEIDDQRIAALIDEKTRAFQDLIGRDDVLYPGAEACVRRLEGEFPVGIASGALRHEIEAILERHAMRSIFRFIVAAGDTAASKPAPDPYRRAAELHGLPPSSCVAIEDSRWGIMSARAAGLRCIGITHTYPADGLREAHAVVSSLDEITPDFVIRVLKGSEGC